MKILIADIPDEGLSLDIEEPFEPDDYSLIQAAAAHVNIEKAEHEIIISGGMNAEIEFECSRCLKKFIRKMDIPLHAVYHPVREMRAEKHELKNDELDTGFYSGDELDLHEILKEHLLLNVQMKPLCDENCKGICPHCGTDLNIGKCGCKTRDIDPRLEALRKLL